MLFVAFGVAQMSSVNGSYLIIFSDKGSPEYKAAISNLLQKMQQTVKMPKDESVYDRLEQEPQQLPQQQQQFDQRQIPGIENRQTGISLAGQTQDLRISGSQEVPFFEGMLFCALVVR